MTSEWGVTRFCDICPALRGGTCHGCAEQMRIESAEAQGRAYYPQRRPIPAEEIAAWLEEYERQHGPTTTKRSDETMTKKQFITGCQYPGCSNSTIGRNWTCSEHHEHADGINEIYVIRQANADSLYELKYALMDVATRTLSDSALAVLNAEVRIEAEKTRADGPTVGIPLAGLVEAASMGAFDANAADSDLVIMDAAKARLEAEEGYAVGPVDSSNCTFFYFSPAGKWKYEGRGVFPRGQIVGRYYVVDHDAIFSANDGMPGISGDGKSFIVFVIPDDCDAPAAYPRMIFAPEAER